jgi:hypothetical protein
MRARRLFLAGCCALGAALVVGVGVGAATSSAKSGTVYDAIPGKLPPNMPSLGFQSNHTSELGDQIHLGRGGRKLVSVMVTFSDHALHSLYPSFGDAKGWTYPVTINIYTNHLDGNGAPDQLIASTTQDTFIPWRPEGTVFCADHSLWKAPDGNCYTGIAFNATFNMSNLKVFLPDDIIVGIVYNTETFGPEPTGTDGPWISLNVGAHGAATIGTDDDTDAVFLNGDNAPAYSSPGLIGIFREDTNWSPYGTLPIRVVTK